MQTQHAKTQKPKVLIVGGSLGGLFAANILLQDGWDVEVLERTPESLSARGAGIVTHPELFEALRVAGVKIDDEIGVNVDQRITLDQKGSIIGKQQYPQILTAWSKMYQVLRDVFPNEKYHHDINVQEVSSDGNKAIVTLSDGKTLIADLVVAADGFRSAVRHKYLPKSDLEYVGYVAWRGVVDESQLSIETRQSIFENFAFCLPNGEQILGYPVAGKDNSLDIGHRRFNFVWYRPADEENGLKDLLTDDKGNIHPNGIPPQLIREEIIYKLKSEANKLLSPQFAEIVQKTEQLVFQPIYDLTVDQLVFGRVVLLGDAAFVARPHCGMGVTKAAGDAMQLAASLKKFTSVDDALSDYESKRLSFGYSIINHARHLGAYMQSQLKNELERKMAEKYRTPEAVMKETAVPPSL